MGRVREGSHGDAGDSLCLPAVLQSVSPSLPASTSAPLFVLMHCSKCKL